MDVKILKSTDRELELEVAGDKTLVTLVRAYLLQDENVEFAAFSEEHPLEGKMRLYVRVKEGNPRDALKAAVERAKADFILFQTQVSEVLQ